MKFTRIKKICLVLIACLFVSCRETKKFTPPNGSNLTVSAKDFFDCEKIFEDYSAYDTNCFGRYHIEILRDRNSDVLYICSWSTSAVAVTPIYKNDGGLLTYKDWLNKYHSNKE